MARILSPVIMYSSSTVRSSPVLNRNLDDAEKEPPGRDVNRDHAVKYVDDKVIEPSTTREQNKDRDAIWDVYIFFRYCFKPPRGKVLLDYQAEFTQ